MFDRIIEDVRTARETDPAAKSTAEVALLYGGLHAVWVYRVAHWLWDQDYQFTARALSELAKFLTGVEIHPDAELGDRVFIDHGMGVVIGETADIGDDVNMYHGVTLGGDDPRPVKRHPTVEDDVTLGANATLVGDITIGEGATIGAGAVVADDVPAGATMVGNPAERVDTEEREGAEAGDAVETEAPRTGSPTADGEVAVDDPPRPCCDATTP